MKTSIDYNSIQKDIEENIENLTNGILDVYDYCGELTQKYIEPIFPESMDCEEENPYLDLIFAMLEINGIELY